MDGLLSGIGQMLGMLMYVIMMFALIPVMLNLVSGMLGGLRFAFKPVYVSVSDGKARVDYRYCGRRVYAAYVNVGGKPLIVERSDGTVRVDAGYAALLIEEGCIEGRDTVYCEGYGFEAGAGNVGVGEQTCRFYVEVGDCLNEDCSERKPAYRTEVIRLG